VKKGRRGEDEKKIQVTNRKTVIGDLVEKERRLKRRLKASIPYVQTTSHRLFNIKHFVVFPAIGGLLSCPKGTNSINN
jgi:hypothetical protein